MGDQRDSRPDLPLLLVGTDHRCSPLELRERVSYSGDAAEELLVHLLARPEVAEAALVSTCNRTEAYVEPRDDEAAYHAVVELAFASRAPELTGQGRLYVRRGRDAAHHLMAVAGGLESMVLGEPEILGQVKQAAALADAVGTSGTLVRRLFRAALKAGSRARAETAISSGAVSLGYATVELTKAIFTRIEEAPILVVGAGQAGRMVARNLLEKGAGRLTVTNRTQLRVEEFLREFPGAQSHPFDDRALAVAAADVVVVATGAGEPVLTRGHLQAAMARRPGRPLLIVDLGVPRNVDPAAARLGNVFLHHVDSLETLIQRNLKLRREEIPRVEEIVEEELGHLLAWYRGMEAEPLIARLQKQAERVRRQEVAAALDRFPAETHEQIDRLTRSLVRKILHHPSKRLRNGNGEEILPHLDLVRELFQLDGEEET
ncbi:MAG TPA: glutamyl-tRNA reductase [Thermoanaerobaculia bacterium]|nr:glutamyl-tRNA reductase [Thermoanaerobaculia bacterium]